MCYRVIIRYLCAIVWMGLLSAFSYGDWILNLINQNGTSFEDKIIESHSSSLVVLCNVGLVTMLYIDKLITHFITKQHNKSHYIDVILVFDILIAFLIYAVVQLVLNDKSFVLVSWFKLSYLFIPFILSLVIYKADTLKIRHTSSNSDILPSKNI